MERQSERKDRRKELREGRRKEGKGSDVSATFSEI